MVAWCGRGRDGQVGQHTPSQEACTTHLHRAAARTCMLRSRSDHCLSPPCPTTPQRPVSRLTTPGVPSCLRRAGACCAGGIPWAMLPCRTAQQCSTVQRSAGRLPMPCRRASAVQEEASDQGAAVQAPRHCRGNLKTEGAYHPHRRNQCCKFCHARWCLPISTWGG